MALNAKPKHLRDNRFLDGTPTATDTDSDSSYDVLNIIDWRTFTFWKAASSGTKYLTVNCGSAKSADSLGIIGHNFSTASATISVEYSTTGAWSGEEVVALSGFTVSTDKAFIKTFNSSSAQYWRVKIVTAAIVPYCAVVCLGEIFTYERYPMTGFDPASEKIHARSSKSKGGNYLGSVIDYYEILTSLNFKKLTPSWITNTFISEWEDHLRLLKPVFLVWDITNHSTDVFYVYIPAKFTLKMPFDPVRRSLKLKFIGIVEE